MTEPIPPCPVCGTVPEHNHTTLGHKCHGVRVDVYPHHWRARCDQALGRALRAHGVHTIQQLTGRLALDPRVADDTILAFAELPDLIAARDYLETLIAAQRGEG